MPWPLPGYTWLAITLFKLASPTNLHYVNYLFDMGKATAGEAVVEVCSAL